MMWILCFIYTKFCVLLTQCFMFYLHKVLCLSVQKGAQNRKYLVKL